MSAEKFNSPWRAWLPYVVRTSDGRVLTGLIAAETDASLILRRAEGVEDVILSRDVDDIRSSGQSLMPEGFERQLTVPQMADLLRYLSSQRK